MGVVYAAHDPELDRRKDKVALAEVEDWLAKRKDNKEKTPLG
jgi:hypothetical protein